MADGTVDGTVEGIVDGEHGPPMDADALSQHSRRLAQEILPA